MSVSYIEFIDAIHKNDFDRVEDFILKGTRFNDAEPLNVAIRNGNLEIVNLLIDNNFPLLYDAIEWAISYGHIEVVKLLHEKRGFMPPSDWALSRLVENKQFEMIRYLLAQYKEIDKAFEFLEKLEYEV